MNEILDFNLERSKK